MNCFSLLKTTWSQLKEEQNQLTGGQCLLLCWHSTNANSYFLHNTLKHTIWKLENKWEERCIILDRLYCILIFQNFYIHILALSTGDNLKIKDCHVSPCL